MIKKNDFFFHFPFRAAYKKALITSASRILGWLAKCFVTASTSSAFVALAVESYNWKCFRYRFNDAISNFEKSGYIYVYIYIQNLIYIIFVCCPGVCALCYVVECECALFFYNKMFQKQIKHIVLLGYI